MWGSCKHGLQTSWAPTGWVGLSPGRAEALLCRRCWFMQGPKQAEAVLPRSAHGAAWGPGTVLGWGWGWGTAVGQGVCVEWKSELLVTNGRYGVCQEVAGG